MAALEIPELPVPMVVALDPETTAVLCLDISDTSTKSAPACLASVPAVRRLLDAARSSGARVIFTLGRPAEQKISPDLAPRDDEGVVRSSADKFFNTDLEQRLAGISSVVVVGTAANGAVLYTGFGACARGFSVIVAEDGISSRDPLATWFARWQLLNQPGFANVANAVGPKLATLSRTDLISFTKVG
ncbi:MAG TPA: isochorismatase family cysteine hydrolase [Candidatus Limnocylindria bacterium]|nr:isochorismatase family cysteine hydrolase [Candidatus Limnocylindria bacterium]